MKDLAALPFAFACRFLDALVLLWFWRWFAVPLGAPAIGYWQTMGLTVLTSWVCVQAYVPHKYEDDYSLGAKVIGHIVSMLLVFGIGWLVHLQVQS